MSTGDCKVSLQNGSAKMAPVISDHPGKMEMDFPRMVGDEMDGADICRSEGSASPVRPSLRDGKVSVTRSDSQTLRLDETIPATWQSVSWKGINCAMNGTGHPAH